MDFLLKLLKGLVIGAGAIAPGVSGGALAVIFGMYENLTHAIANIFKDFKNKFAYLLPIGLGGIIGILVFSNVFKYLFENYNVQIRYLFIGLMIGTFPSLFKIANKNGFKKSYIVSFAIALAITIMFVLLENTVIDVIPNEDPGLLEFILYGMIVGIGTVIPGVSSSVMLMYIDAYDIVLEATATVNLRLLIPIGIGFVLCFFLLTKVISFLFDRLYGYTYFAILGFVLGSILPIFPGFAMSSEYFVSVIIMVVGFYASYRLSKHEKE